ncbi:hypothetical protein [Rhodococcus sp. KBS0724]|uniref:hypothetical protein n=1 Tax=Rhodococcus sp. KBS0724 TaxID=1179674 RepID=UPI0021B102F4|nr:hypothetical protein [Rhodococcus sp. KBS0724]
MIVPARTEEAARTGSAGGDQSRRPPAPVEQPRRVGGENRCSPSHCLRKEPELEPEPEPSSGRTASEQLKRVAEQVCAIHQKSSIFAVRTKRRFEDVTTFKNEGIGISSIVRQVGLARETIHRFYYASSVDELLGAPGLASPPCWTSSPRICTSVSMTDVPPLLHFTKSFEHSGIAAVTALSAITFVRSAG